MAKRKKKTVKEEKEIIEVKEEKKEIDEYVPFLILLAFILIIRLFIASPVRVQQTSMIPTLEEGDILLLYKLKRNTKGVSRFDIVVVKSNSGTIVKRVIGLPGETIKYEVTEENGQVKNALYVDGKKVEEEFVADEYKNQTCWRNFKLCSDGITLGDDEYFVMGDNRKGSYDSRDMGAMKDKQIKGIAEIRLFPFSKFGRIDK